MKPPNNLSEALAFIIGKMNETRKDQILTADQAVQVLTLNTLVPIARALQEQRTKAVLQKLANAPDELLTAMGITPAELLG